MRRRLTALGVAGLVLVAGLLVRAYAAEPIAQPAGTMLYAALVYVGVFVLRPGTSPVPAGLAAVGFCWLVEFAQLTGVPADLSERSLVARLVLGSEFDWTDVAWYPVGVVPLVVAHLAIRARGRPGLRGA